MLRRIVVIGTNLLSNGFININANNNIYIRFTYCNSDEGKSIQNVLWEIVNVSIITYIAPDSRLLITTCRTI